MSCLSPGKAGYFSPYAIPTLPNSGPDGEYLTDRLTDEAIGSGDGWFFTVSGLYLTPVLNLKLLIYGTFLSGLICGGIYFYSRLKGKEVRRKPVAFLPFLVLVWIGLVIL